jgi:hypothetical protein
LWCQVKSYYLLWSCSRGAFSAPPHCYLPQVKTPVPQEGKTGIHKAGLEFLDAGGHGGRASRAAPRPGGFCGGLADELRGHDASDEFLYAVSIEIDGRAFGIGIGNDAESVNLMIDVLPHGKNLQGYLLHRRSENLGTRFEKASPITFCWTGLADCLARGW